MSIFNLVHTVRVWKFTWFLCVTKDYPSCDLGYSVKNRFVSCGQYASNYLAFSSLILRVPDEEMFEDTKGVIKDR
jgi:hypothetical protein